MVDFGRILGVDGLVDGQSGRTNFEKWTDRFQSFGVQIAEGGKIWLLKNEMLKSGVRCEVKFLVFFSIAG